MAFDVRYRARFQNLGINTTYRIDILSNDPVSIITPWKMGADPLTFNTLAGSKDEYPVIIGSEIAFEFVLNKHMDESDYDELFESAYRDHIVKFYNNDTSELLWQGYLQPENMSKSIFESNLHIYLSATDALKDLSDFDFLDDDLLITGRKTGLQILKYCLTKLDQDSKFQYNFIVKLGTKYTGEVADSNPLYAVTHDCRRFFENQDGKTVVDKCQTVIEKILEPYNCVLRQYGGAYHIQHRYEGKTHNYVYDWTALTLQNGGHRIDAPDGIIIDTYKSTRSAEKSMMSSVKEIGQKLLNRNMGGQLVGNINDFSTGWDLSDFKPDPTPESGNTVLHMYLIDEVVGRRTITLASNFNLTKITNGDYIKLKFQFQSANVLPVGSGNPKFIITVIKAGVPSVSWEEVITNEWRLYESPNDEVFRITQSGAADYNISITFQQSDYAGADYSQQVYIKNFDLTHIVVVEEATYTDITFDRHYKATSIKGKTIAKDKDFYFGDSPGTNDLAALAYGGSNTATWNRYNKTDNFPLLQLHAWDFLTSRQDYAEYLIMNLKDRSDNITPLNFLTFGSKNYSIVSYSKSFRTSWVTVHLRERITGDVDMTYIDTPLTSVDGNKAVDNSFTPVIVPSPYTAHDLLTNLSYALAGHTGFAPINNPTFTTKVTTPLLKVTTGAAAGAILISDASGDLTYLAAGATTKILVGGGAANPVWTEATGSGAPVRAGSPIFTTQIIAPIVYGSSAADGDITIRGTSHATKTTSYVILQDTGGYVGIGTVIPASPFSVVTPNSDVDVIVARFVHRAAAAEKGAIVQIGGSDSDLGYGVQLRGYANPNLNFNGRFEVRTSSGSNVWNLGLLQDKDGNVAVGFATPLSKLCINGGLHVGGESAAGDNNLWVDGISQHPDFLPDFGFFGNNWRITAAGDAEFDNVLVRHKLTAFTLEVDKIDVVGGRLVVSPASGTVYSWAYVAGTEYTLVFDTNNNTNPIQFVVGDFVTAQTYKAYDHVIVDSFSGVVTAVTQHATLGSAHIHVTPTTGTPWDGMRLAQLGSTVAGRQSLLYLTSSDTNNPFIEGHTGVTDGSFTNATRQFRLGNLTGITDAVMGALSGYGLYSQNAYLKGKIIADTGLIGGWTINSVYLAKDTGTAATSAGMAPLDYPFYAGAIYANRATAPFAVTNAGKAYVSNLIYRYTGASDTVMFSDDTAVSTTAVVYTLMKTLTLGTLLTSTKTLRIKFDLRTVSTAYHAFGQIWRNGAPVGTEQETASEAFVTYSEDIAGWDNNDDIELYIKSTLGFNVHCQNFRICGSHASVFNEVAENV